MGSDQCRNRSIGFEIPPDFELVLVVGNKYRGSEIGIGVGVEELT